MARSLCTNLRISFGCIRKPAGFRKRQIAPIHLNESWDGIDLGTSRGIVLKKRGHLDLETLNLQKETVSDGDIKRFQYTIFCGLCDLWLANQALLKSAKRIRF